jgi:hypothetical protein
MPCIAGRTAAFAIIVLRFCLLTYITPLDYLISNFEGTEKHGEYTGY